MCARLCGAGTWSDVCSRTPHAAGSPLYYFEVYTEGDCVFRESSACWQLSEELWKVCEVEGFDVQKCEVWLTDVLRTQPAFLLAGLHKALLEYESEDLDVACNTIDHFVALAEDQIPKGFSGPILWGCATNRFYHRMLSLQMDVRWEIGDVRGALTSAKKKLRCDPNDAVLLYMPELLELNGQPAQAKKWQKKCARMFPS